MMDMMKMMKQARQMQKRMAEVREDVDRMETTFTASGVVKVTARGDNTIARIEIAPTAVDPADIEGLEDLLLTAVNGALREIQESAKGKMAEVAGGMDLSQLGL